MASPVSANTYNQDSAYIGRTRRGATNRKLSPTSDAYANGRLYVWNRRGKTRGKLRIKTNNSGVSVVPVITTSPDDDDLVSPAVAAPAAVVGLVVAATAVVTRAAAANTTGVGVGGAVGVAFGAGGAEDLVAGAGVAGAGMDVAVEVVVVAGVADDVTAIRAANGVAAANSVLLPAPFEPEAEPAAAAFAILEYSVFHIFFICTTDII